MPERGWDESFQAKIYDSVLHNMLEYESIAGVLFWTQLNLSTTMTITTETVTTRLVGTTTIMQTSTITQTTTLTATSIIEQWDTTRFYAVAIASLLAGTIVAISLRASSSLA